MEAEFSSWQNETSSASIESAIQKALSPLERYALNFKRYIDPYFSQFFVSDFQREVERSTLDEEWDVEAIEKEKAAEEKLALSGDSKGTYELLSSKIRTQDLLKHVNLYNRERSRLLRDKLYSRLTGADWSVKTDGVSQLPFFHNSDTGESRWDKPKILQEKDDLAWAYQAGWAGLSVKLLVATLQFLTPVERMVAASVCKIFHIVSIREEFMLRVVAAGGGSRSNSSGGEGARIFTELGDAVEASLPGDIIELLPGHHWITKQLTLKHPVYIEGDERNCSSVVLEVGSGGITWNNSLGVHGRYNGGGITGVSIRRPKPDSTGISLMTIEGNTKLAFDKCVFDAANLDNSNCVVKIVESDCNTIEFEQCVVKGSENGCGIWLDKSKMKLEDKGIEYPKQVEVEEKEEETAMEIEEEVEVEVEVEVVVAKQNASPVKKLSTRGAWSKNKNNAKNLEQNEKQQQQTDMQMQEADDETVVVPVVPAGPSAASKQLKKNKILKLQEDKKIGPVRFTLQNCITEGNKLGSHLVEDEQRMRLTFEGL